MIEKLEALRKSHRAAWMKYNKPFGFEVLDIRYGGIRSRLDTAKYRIDAYLNGECDRLEELEAERLRIDCVEGDADIFAGRFLWRSYQGIATPNIL
jgi:hypothetical protein